MAKSIPFEVKVILAKREPFLLSLGMTEEPVRHRQTRFLLPTVSAPPISVSRDGGASGSRCPDQQRWGGRVHQLRVGVAQTSWMAERELDGGSPIADQRSGCKEYGQGSPQA